MTTTTAMNKKIKRLIEKYRTTKTSYYKNNSNSNKNKIKKNKENGKQSNIDIMHNNNKKKTRYKKEL